MEALYLLNFWRPTTINTHNDYQPSNGNSDATRISSNVVNIDDELEEEGEDSFFELELTVPNFDNNKSNSSTTTTTTTNNSNSDDDNNNNKRSYPLDRDSNSFDSNEVTLHSSAKTAGNSEQKFQRPSPSLSPTEFLFKRKILPIEPISKPQSPVSLLKSAPRFRILMFKKSKSMAADPKTEKMGGTEFGGVSVDTPTHKKQESRLLTVKFKLQEAASVPVFTRENSLTKHMASESLSGDTSKRFSKELIQKYLKLINPLYIKVSKKHNDKMKFSAGDLVVASPSCSPSTAQAPSPKKDKHGNIPAGFRVVCKHLGKSKSSSATTGTVSRRDDSLLLQHDGIQSAILHCKKSFNSSRSDSSLLSRVASDSSHDKSMASPRISKEENGIN